MDAFCEVLETKVSFREQSQCHELRKASATHSDHSVGFQNFHTSVTAGYLCTLLPKSVCLLLLSPIVICWQAGRDGENPSLWFLSLHLRGVTCGPDRQTLLRRNTLSITAEMIRMKSRILHILNDLSSSAIRIKTFVFTFYFFFYFYLLCFYFYF